MTDQTQYSTAESLRQHLDAFIGASTIGKDGETELRKLIGKIEEAAYKRGIDSNLALMEASIDQAEAQQTSIIRATVAAVLESASKEEPYYGDDGGFKLTMNLEAQRTIWDRVELTTERDASQENVTFTIHKK